MRAERLEPKGKQSRPECLTSGRRELTRLPVYGADLNPPVMDAEHGKAASLDYAGRSQPNRKAGPAGAALGWPKKPKPECNVSDMPTSVWPGKARKSCGTTSTWESNRQATPVAWCTRNRCPQEQRYGRPQPGIAKWPEGITMRSVRHRFSSSRGSGAWKGLALERFEPCEGKLSRTVLWGAWAG
jgi:hypothetical protein